MANRMNAIGMDTTTGMFNIADPDDTFMAPSLGGNSGTPAAVAGAALGTGAGNPTVTGTNLAGTITFTTASLAVVAGVVFTMTFANSLTFPNGCTVTLAAGNTNCATVITTLYCTTTTTTVVLNVSAGLGIATTYTGFYQVVGY